MCGRFANATDPDQLRTVFKAILPEAMGHNRPPRWNVAPGTGIETIVLDDANGSAGRRIAPAHWGMASPKSARLLINAKGETMFDKPSFGDSSRHRRCLVVSTGWYEWKAPKKPYFIRYSDGAPMALAGIFRREGGQRHAVVVTRKAVGGLKEVHHRAPLPLEGQSLERWLDPSSPQSAIMDIVMETGGGGLDCYPVSAAVGSVSEDHEGLIRRDDSHGQPPPAQMDLFRA